MKYLVIIEKTNMGYSAYSPDLEGCIATGQSETEVRQTMQEAILFHLDGLKEEGFPPPLPHSHSVYLDIPA